MSIFDKAWGAVKDAWGSVTGTAKKVTGAPSMSAPTVDESRFEFGRGRAGQTSADVARDYARQAAALRDQADFAQRRQGRDFSASRDEIAAIASTQGPSAAEAQLRAGQDAAMRQQLALARSGRGLGGGAASMRQAASTVADLQAQTSQQAAALRAQEEDAFRQRQLSTLGALRSQDLQQAMHQASLNDARSAQLLGAGLQAQGMRDQVLGTELGAQQQYELARTGLLGQAAQTNAQLRQQNRQGWMGLAGSLIGGAAMLAASDRRSKEQVRSLAEENDALKRTLAALSGPTTGELDEIGRDAIATIRQAPGYTYRYTDPDAPGRAPGLQAGPMAQDLEKTPLGASLVREAPDGTKMVDTGRAGLTALAAASEQQRELDRVREEQERLQRELSALRGPEAPRPSTPAWLTGGR